MPASGAVDITVKKIGRITRVKMDFLTTALGVANGTFSGRLSGKLLSYRTVLDTATGFTIALVDEIAGAPIHTALAVVANGLVAVPQMTAALIVAMMTNTLTVNITVGGVAKTATIYLYLEDNSDG